MLPCKKVKIGWKTLSIEPFENLNTEEGIDGDISWRKARLRYDPQGDVLGTLIHEISHGVHEFIKMHFEDFARISEEDKILIFENKIRQFIGDNPELCLWLLECAKNEARNSSQGSQGTS